MQLLSVIAEYNPFHNGHQWHLQHSKALSGATHTLVLMSGSVVQRGTFACADKWIRARTALLCGADLVCELPYVYAGQSAEIFAKGAIKILNACGCCRWLSFGSEAGRLELLAPVAAVLANESDAFKTALRDGLNQGLSYPQARASAAASCCPDLPVQTLLASPNNILGIEYLKALVRTQSTITPVTFKRAGAAYHDLESNSNHFASATALRALLSEVFKKQDAQAASRLAKQLPYPADLLKDASALRPDTWEADFYKSLIHTLMLTPLEALRELPGAEPGFEFRLKGLPEHTQNLETLYTYLTTRHLPKSRIQRLVMALASGFRKKDINRFIQPDFVPYLRVLGFNDKGREILKTIRHQGQLPVLTNLRSNQTQLNEEQKACLFWDLQTTDLYSLYCQPHYTHGLDYRQPPVYVH